MYVFSVKSLLSMISVDFMNCMMDSVKSAMLCESDTTTPIRTTVKRESSGGQLMLMPSLSDDFWGLKVLTLFPDNPGKGKPFIHGIVVLMRAEDGEFAAIFDGSLLTAIRTGAVSGLGIRSISGANVKKLGLIGAGFQGYWQARFACAARAFNEIWVYDIIEDKLSEYKKRIEGFAHDMGISVNISKSAADVIENSEVIITATTSKQPLFDGRDMSLYEGKVFVGIGSYKPEMREYPDEFFVCADKVYVDTLHALEETGDLIFPIKSGYLDSDKIFPLSTVFGKAAESGTYLYKSVGGASFDLFTAKKIFEMSKEQNILDNIDL
ncbi:MAG: ornithine cyclodeaminase family protein [Synergistaceae bacterium]|nr:ornithine cyclodeaminase family protein [Synergistaceae bacterium]